MAYGQDLCQDIVSILQRWRKVGVSVGILCLDSNDGAKVSVIVVLGLQRWRKVSVRILCLDFHDGVRSVLVSGSRIATMP